GAASRCVRPSRRRPGDFRARPHSQEDTRMSKDIVDQLYDKVVSKPERIFGPEYYGDFLNWGYWKADTETQVEACENLVEMVASMIPKRDGTLLEVGCGV